MHCKTPVSSRGNSNARPPRSIAPFATPELTVPSSSSSSSALVRSPLLEAQSCFHGCNRRAVEAQRKLRGVPSRSSLSPTVSAKAVPASQSSSSKVLKTVTVELGDRAYPIFIGNGALQSNRSIDQQTKTRMGTQNAHTFCAFEALDCLATAFAWVSHAWCRMESSVVGVRSLSCFLPNHFL